MGPTSKGREGKSEKKGRGREEGEESEREGPGHPQHFGLEAPVGGCASAMLPLDELLWPLVQQQQRRYLSIEELHNRQQASWCLMLWQCRLRRFWGFVIGPFDAPRHVTQVPACITPPRNYFRRKSRLVVTETRGVLLEDSFVVLDHCFPVVARFRLFRHPPSSSFSTLLFHELPQPSISCVITPAIR